MEKPQGFKFEDLRVYQESLVFVAFVFGLTKSWSTPYKFTLANQLQRAALSIALNIAEGSSRTARDFAHFLSVSRGSCYECVAILTVARNEKLVTLQQYAEAYETLQKLARMITSLKRSITAT
ncbi:four helix bundle protein [Candidatus Gottesmanbacteria bacterium]|nr:four helix bundle protein [Candidatus Gottesmanbacteria bacterium]